METKYTKTLIGFDNTVTKVTINNETCQLLDDLDRLYWNTSDLCKYYRDSSGQKRKTYDRIAEDFDTIKRLKYKLQELIIYKDKHEKMY